MRSNEFLWEICLEIYRKMYQEADPPADFDKLIRDGVTKEENWFLNYYLPIERQIEIINEFCEKYRCNRKEREAIEVEVLLGSAPSSVRRLSVL